MLGDARRKEHLFKKGRRWKGFAVGIAFFGVTIKGFVGHGKLGTFGNHGPCITNAFGWRSWRGPW